MVTVNFSWNYWEYSYYQHIIWYSIANYNFWQVNYSVPPFFLHFASACVTIWANVCVNNNCIFLNQIINISILLFWAGFKNLPVKQLKKARQVIIDTGLELHSTYIDTSLWHATVKTCHILADMMRCRLWRITKG